MALSCHKIPYGLNPRFYERELELAKLHEVLYLKEKYQV
jgi:hypothetical protein